MNRSARTTFCLPLLGILLLGLPATSQAAHPIPIVPVTAFVTRYKLTLRADVFVEDLKLFHELEADEMNYLPKQAVLDGIEKHKGFLLKKILVRDIDGNKLQGKITDVVDFDIDERGVSADRLMEKFISYHIEYDLKQPPEFLTFTQLIGADRLLPSEVDLRVKQSGSEAGERKVLRPGKNFTVRFDWKNKPLSEDASKKEEEEWYEQRRRDTLGIDEYGSVYSFIYITPREVRHEVLIPLGTLESDFKIDRQDPAFLDVAEQEAGRALVAKAFEYNNPVWIDGVEVKAVVDRIDFYGLSLKDFAMRAEKRRVSTASCRVGIILRYSTKGLPQQVRIKWDKFDRNILRVDSVVFTQDKPAQHTFTKTNSEFSWTAPEAPPLPQIESVACAQPSFGVPVFSILCLLAFPVALIAIRDLRKSLVASLAVAATLCFAGWLLWPYGRWQQTYPFARAQAPNHTEAKALFAALHKNTYRAFDYHTESDVYDALSKSVDGELLRQLYLDIHSRLAMQEQGGAVARVEEVKIVEGAKSDDANVESPGFGYQCRWTVSGTVEHWGHIHNRVNEYAAHFVIQPRDEAWKITDLEITDERRVRFRTSLRDF